MLGSPQKCSSFWPRWRDNKLFTLLLGIFLVYATVYLGALIQNNFRQFFRIGLTDAPARTIVISGEGKVVATPTVATANIGIVTEKKDVLSAQEENSAKMNAVIKAVKELGVKDTDIQTTQYQIYPRYDYTDGRSALVGYGVSQNVAVKIRDFSKISAVLERAAALGANQVSGISFTIDDPRLLSDEAREKAIVNAREKAINLSRVLGVRLGKVVSFNEYGGTPPSAPLPFYMKEGIGGEGRVAPEIESGSVEVTSNVSITYEIE